MANITKKRSQNVEGTFFVDDTCIDCGTCYWMAPGVFSRVQGQSAVVKQPASHQDQKSIRALYSCPTASIGSLEKGGMLKKLAHDFPYPLVENIYHNGFHSRDSFGAASFFIKRDEGNILVDSPRFLKQITKNIQSMGGIDYYYLSHKDDVADTDKFHAHFSGSRIIHDNDTNSQTKKYEILITGYDTYHLASDLIVIPTPGHTQGSTVLLYKNEFLFTGDHLCWSRDLGHLIGFRNACWYDWNIQIKSMERLLDYEFRAIFPGHGSPYQATSSSEMKEELKKCIQWMKESA